MQRVMNGIDLASVIDHTLLKPDTTYADIEQLAAEAIEHGFAAICVPPFFVQEAAQLLEGKAVKVATVVGFPFGYNPTSAKVDEVKSCIDKGADEIDAVVNLPAVKNHKWAYVTNDIQSITTAAHLQGKVVKIIIETGMLTDAEIGKLCEICTAAEVDYLKTSTGFNGQGATVEAVRQLRSLLPENIKIKASGGIRNLDFAKELLEAGANRIGTSSGVQLIQEA
jgi:deoxyribose-phosphate aldolase